MENKPDGWIRSLVHAEVEKAQMNMTAREHFDATVKRIDDESDAAEIRKVIGDCWGHRTWMVEVQRG